MKGFFIKLIIVCCLIIFSITVMAQTKIRFGVTNFYPPFVFSSKSGYIHGLDIDTVRAICQEINAECTFTPMPLSQMFKSIDNNSMDAIIGAISITPMRKEHYDFTRPYLKSTMSFITLRSSDIDPSNIQGKRLGVVKDSTFYTYLLNKYGNGIKLFTYNTNEQLVTALSNKEIDAVLIDSPAAHYWVGYSTGLFKTIGTPVFLSFDEGYGIAVKKGNSSLLNAINNALNTIIQNGTFDKIKQSYFAK